jgi:uncharacterized membrane protein YfcA
MASGIFIVPLTILAGVDIHTAIGASLVSVIACSCGSAADYLNNRLTNIRLAVVLETATTFGALTGVLLAGIVPGPWLFVLFSIILAVSAVQVLSRRRESIVAGDGRWAHWRLDSSYPDQKLGRDIAYQIHRLPAGMSLMYGAGLISALLGIGSGVLKIPAMGTALKLPIKVSSATSNFMIGVTAAASASAYFVRGEIVAPVAGPVALGSVIGAIVGARLLLVMPSEKLRLLFVAVLVILAVQMLLGAFGIDLLRGAA